jgi:double zinc ribbon protein
VNELERLYRQLIHNLSARDPSSLHQPLALSDLRERVIPYRANRRALQLESSEEYELALMRLCAGEGGLARAEPEAIRGEFAMEVRSPNPDLTLLDKHAQAVVILESEPLARALAPTTEDTYAPPVERRRVPRSAPAQPSPAKRSQRPLQLCVNCHATLPAGRAVKFCPHCGTSQALTRCPRCRAVLDPGWKHCVACGASVRAD